ncbi:hypothetical protein J437_LFUL009298 [Ladona fulva]|uniref:Arf-GAP domain-containing protein n=1 Tax=Ladona fulva TaxID=123851 RepID=A0A8K0K630_LADFU|nr:hypothetical protein J437_LFUL009298 [Ladona fulva]
MASARKKQDEKHLKILRELVSLQGNKQCFDCHQRGPTYVNMTIGSFVCTSCSGMLRGLTPPHRVKSISMASFTPEEIELIKSRGNEFCKRVWLGLYDPSHEQEAKDEQQIKDFMTSSSTDNIHIASSDFSKMSSSTAATWLRDFGAKDPFSSSSPSLVATGNTPNASSSSSLQQPSFANFDNNPIFTSPNTIWIHLKLE